MQFRAWPYRTEVPEREKGDAVHAMRTQVNYAPILAVLVEDRFGLDATWTRWLSSCNHAAYCTISRGILHLMT